MIKRSVEVIEKEEKVRKMTPEETLKEINGLIGAVDGKTLARVRRLINLLHAYQWTTGELTLLCPHQDEEYRRNYLSYIRNKLTEMIEMEDERLRTSK